MSKASRTCSNQAHVTGITDVS